MTVLLHPPIADSHLDLGCGTLPRNPYGRSALFGVDIRRLESTSTAQFHFAAANLALEPIPFADSRFMSVSAFDFLEHIPRVLNGTEPNALVFPFVRLMSEVWRVLVPGGLFYALTPCSPGTEAFTDPTHVNGPDRAQPRILLRRRTTGPHVRFRRLFSGATRAMGHPRALARRRRADAQAVVGSLAARQARAPRVLPVGARGGERHARTMTAPRISLIPLACNQQSTVRAAAESCLAQHCEPLEIVLSDDASTDETFDVMAEVATAYRGPHRVRARRNPSNLGIGAHYNQLQAETSGDLLVTAAADDLSLPHRVARLSAAWDATGQSADLIASHFFDMAEDGTPGQHVVTDDLAQLTLEGWCRRRPYTIGATHAFTLRLAAHYGPFIDGVWYEDPVMVLRAITGGGAITLPEALVHYRRGGTSRWPRVQTGDELVAWVGIQNRRVLAEIRQHAQDARAAGVEPAVEAALAVTFKRENYIAAMLSATGAAQRWRACRTTSGLPWGWRLRKFLTFTFPDQAARLKRTKARWRGR